MTEEEIQDEISMLPTQQCRMDAVGNGRSEVIPSEELHDVLYGLIDENKS